MSKCSPARGYKDWFTCPNFRQKLVKSGFLGANTYWEFTCSCTGEKLNISFIDSVCSDKNACLNCSNRKKYGIRNQVVI